VDEFTHPRSKVLAKPKVEDKKNAHAYAGICLLFFLLVLSIASFWNVSNNSKRFFYQRCLSRTAHVVRVRHLQRYNIYHSPPNLFPNFHSLQCSFVAAMGVAVQADGSAVSYRFFWGDEKGGYFPWFAMYI